MKELIIHQKRIQNPFKHVRWSFLQIKNRKLLLQKETMAQMFSWEFCKNFNKIFFYRTPRVAASVMYFYLLDRSQDQLPKIATSSILPMFQTFKVVS